MTLSNLTAYVSIPENSAATPGLFDSRFNTLHGNVTQVNNDLSVVSTSVSNLSVVVSSVSGSGISGVRDVTLARYGGAVGDGTTDDRSAFNTGSLSVATQAVLYAPSAASIYRIASSLTISGSYFPTRGAVLRPVSGATIRITGEIMAGPYRLFDTSLGGAFDFTGNTELGAFRPQWFGVTGDGVTNDQPALVSMMSMIPDNTSVEFSSGMQVKLGTTWTFNNRAGIRLRSHNETRPNGTGASPTFLWAGPKPIWASDGSMTSGSSLLDLPSGGATSAYVGEQVVVFSAGGNGNNNPHLRGTVSAVRSATQVSLDTIARATVSGVTAQLSGVMLFLDRCLHCTVEGMHFELDDASQSRNTANIAIDLDGYGGGAFGYGSQCRVEYCNIHASFPNRNAEHVRISETVLSNHEYHKILHNKFISGAVLGRSNGAAHIVSGDSRISTNGNVFSFNNSVMAGLRIRIPNGVSAGTALDTSVVSWNQNTQKNAIMATNASITTDNVDLIFGEGAGTAIKIGGSFNAKRIIIYDNEVIGYRYHVNQLNGSIQATENNVPANECCYNVIEASEPTHIRGDNSETALQFLYASCHQPVAIIGSRFDISCARPNDAYIVLDQTTPLMIEGCTFDSGLPSTSTIFRLQGHAGEVILKGNNFATYTMAQCGLDDTFLASLLFGGTIFAEGNTGIPDQPGFAWQKGTKVYLKHSDDTNATLTVVTNNNSGTNTEAVALLSKTGVGGNPRAMTNFRAEMGTDGIPFGSGEAIGYRSVPPSHSAGVVDSSAGFQVDSPAPSGSGSVTTAYGARIRTQKVSGVGVGYGILQEGVTDFVVYRAPSFATDGQAVQPAYGYSSESSLGLYRSGAATIAPSLGTFNLATNSVRLSVRTLASGDSTNIAVNEAAFLVGGASGASIGIRSNGTIYYFSSSASTKG